MNLFSVLGHEDKSQEDTAPWPLATHIFRTAITACCLVGTHKVKIHEFAS